MHVFNQIYAKPHIWNLREIRRAAFVLMYGDERTDTPTDTTRSVAGPYICFADDPTENSECDAAKTKSLIGC